MFKAMSIILSLFIVLYVLFFTSNSSKANQAIIISQNLEPTLPNQNLESLYERIEHQQKQRKKQEQLQQPIKAVELPTYIIWYPTVQTTVKARQELDRVYKQTVRNVTKLLNSQLLKFQKNSQAFKWDDEKKKKEKLNEILRLEKLIKEIKEEAINEVPKQIDLWRPKSDWSSNRVELQKGPALRQLESINIGIGNFD